jgi:hypothetical protein
VITNLLFRSGNCSNLFFCHNPHVPALRTKSSGRRAGISLRIHVAGTQILSRAKKAACRKKKGDLRKRFRFCKCRDLPSFFHSGFKCDCFESDAAIDDNGYTDDVVSGPGCQINRRPGHVFIAPDAFCRNACGNHVGMVAGGLVHL